MLARLSSRSWSNSSPYASLRSVYSPQLVRRTNQHAPQRRASVVMRMACMHRPHHDTPQGERAFTAFGARAVHSQTTRDEATLEKR